MSSPRPTSATLSAGPRSIGNDYGFVADQSSVSITSPSHPLAAGATGTVALRTTPGYLANGNAAAGADLVGSVAGRPALFAYRPGRLLATGAPARGCRVAFPGHDSSFGVATPTAWSLFDAVVDYSLDGCPAPGPAPK